MIAPNSSILIFYESCSFWLVIVKIVFLVGTCHSVAAQSFTLNGSIVGKDTGVIILYYKDVNQKQCRDQVTIREGKFQFKGTVLGADYVLLDTDSTYTKGDNSYARNLFIEPGILNIRFEYGNIGNAEISGSKVQAASEAWNDQKKEDIRKVKSIASAIDSIKALLKEARIDPHSADNQIKVLSTQSKPIWQAMMEKDMEYIKKYPDSYVSMMLLNYLVGHVPDDSIDLLFSRLSDTVKNSSIGYTFISYFSRYKKAIGEEYPFDKIKLVEQAPAFSIYKGASDSLNLESLKGTVVLLEFWELTCLPCLQANPLIEKIRKQYNSKEVQVIAVNSAAPGEKNKLNSYIAKNKLTDWLHVSISGDQKKLHGSAITGDFKNYYGLGVPRTVLIDKEGNVIYKQFGFTPVDIQNLEAAIQKAVQN